jgi:2-aminoadipate transaminase
MAVRLAKRMSQLEASEIREILKLTQRPEVISFAGGLPAPELFPVEQLSTISSEVLRQEGPKALQYSPTEGDPALREAIASRMRRRLGTELAAEDILITSGAQQGLDLTGKVFLDETDVVLCESPTYLGAIQAFQAYLPRFVEVPTDDDGMILSELERLLREHPGAKLAYVVPDFQNPTGRCWSLERRRGLLDLARRFSVPVVEDQPYGELRFRGHELPTLKSLDEDGLVIFLGTFSKIFCPGLRIGWVAAPRGLVDKYVLAKQGSDLHSSTLSQRQIATYLDRFDLDADIDRIRELYRERCDVMLGTMYQEFPKEVHHTHPDGGLFVWVELPAHLSARDLLAECLERDVAFVPGGSFFPNGGHENTLRLNFSAMPPERIAEGIRRMAQVLRRKLGRVSAAQPAEAPVT